MTKWILLVMGLGAMGCSDESSIKLLSNQPIIIGTPIPGPTGPQGVQGPVGPAGLTGPKGEPGSGGPINKSGKRLEWREHDGLQASDGSIIRNDGYWYDTQLQAECSFLDLGTSGLWCLPVVQEAERAFKDQGCQFPVILVPKTVCRKSEILHTVSILDYGKNACSPSYKSHGLWLATVPEATQEIWRNGPDGCYLTSENPGSYGIWAPEPFDSVYDLNDYVSATY